LLLLNKGILQKFLKICCKHRWRKQLSELGGTIQKSTRLLHSHYFAGNFSADSITKEPNWMCCLNGVAFAWKMTLNFNQKTHVQIKSFGCISKDWQQKTNLFLKSNNMSEYIIFVISNSKQF
jgi:hypothetical protein